MTRQGKSKDEVVRFGLFKSKQRCLDMGTILILPKAGLAILFYFFWSDPLTVTTSHLVEAA